ncbi:MAG: phosphatidylglycerol lysyltransferase domain-containing protein [Rikenellaceae bacterium]|jgi:hypothetical protein|nr:phosphatidylglycerol lysyltransferase domain-containing protein [Rikenellaceae bacterium]
MLEFKKIALGDRTTITAAARQNPLPQLIDCFEAFFLWRDLLDVAWAEWDDFLVFRTNYDGTPAFLFPWGSGDPTAVIGQMQEYAATQKKPFRISKATRAQARRLDALFPGRFRAMYDPNRFEYLYSAEKFRYYRGDPFKAKRNFVNYAKKNLSWAYEEITPANLPECLDFARDFSGDDTFEVDNGALMELHDTFFELQTEGGLIRIEGRVAAFFVVTSLGDPKIAAGLFLRGDHGSKGVIPLLYQEFFLHHPEFERVNLAEDLGLEGLRRNKQSYHPDEMLELCEITLADD